MLAHKYSIGDQAPDSVNAVIEIPKTDAMIHKTTVDFATGEVSVSHEVDPPVPIYWHYGAIPQTLQNDREPLDILIVGDNSAPKPGQQMQVRPIGVYQVADGWHVNDDKIIAVPDIPEYRDIHEISDLPAIEVSEGNKKAFPEIMEKFFSQYRAEDNIQYNGWGSSAEAKKIIATSMHRYDTVPIARDESDENVFPLNQRIFIPGPPTESTPSKFTGDLLKREGMLEGALHHQVYGYIIPRELIQQRLIDAGLSHMLHHPHGRDRKKLIDEKVQLAKTLVSHGAEVFTISSDPEWLEKAAACGVTCSTVDQDVYEVENVVGLSAQDTWTIHYQKANGQHIAIGRSNLSPEEIKKGLVNAGILSEAEDCIAIPIPPHVIPFPLPTSGDDPITQLISWTDEAFNIWPDRYNRPHLVISDAVREMAELTGNTEKLNAFLEQCRPHFHDIHFLKLAPGKRYGTPTNSIDIGTAILTTDDLAEDSRREMEEILQRPIDNSVCLDEHALAGTPGPRCSTFPVSQSVYELLLEGDPIHHLSPARVHRLGEFLYPSSDASLAFRAVVDGWRHELGDPIEINRITAPVRTREVAVVPREDVIPELAAQVGGRRNAQLAV